MKIGRYLVVFLFLMALLITFGNRGVMDNYFMAKRLSLLDEENERLEKQNRELGKKILLLRNDPAYIESIARNELGMVKTGDVVYRLTK
ncbi:MAG TPA: septum formation initiator family protein [Smithellaceae bacterium]|jgi:cell division protein FtsB|nr:septum formation initiator family protein [Smithellaceae bacterium]HQM44803.1 septum formation initiator family protein [Smithellaceae bacterium]